MFVLYYFHQDCDGGECEILGTSPSKENLERKRDELAAPSVAYRKAYKEHEENAKKGIREFCERQRAALKADRMNHYPSDDAERTQKTIKWNEYKEEEKIKDTVRSYYFFTGSAPHTETLYNWHFNKKLLTEALPVFVAPEIPKKGYHEGCMFIEEIVEV